MGFPNRRKERKGNIKKLKKQSTFSISGVRDFPNSGQERNELVFVFSKAFGLS
jgi:hypothetical protein